MGYIWIPNFIDVKTNYFYFFLLIVKDIIISMPKPSIHDQDILQLYFNFNHVSMRTIWLWGRGYDDSVWGRSRFGQQEWGWLVRSNCYLVKRLQNEQTLYGHGCCRLSCNYGGGWLMRLDCCWVKASKWANPMVIGITYWATFLLSFSTRPCDIPFLNVEIWHTLNFCYLGAT
jgi:hypothetical protein